MALTFDDGPDPTYTPLVLNILAHYGVHATFFCVGEQVQAYPDLALQESQQSNAVENHSWSHVNLTVLPPDIVREQIQSTSIEIKQATGITPELFRPPYGSKNENVNNIARELGLTQILWSIDTQDWQQPGVDQIVKTVLTKIKGGDIILMHDGGGNRAETVQALALIISELQQQGFTFIVL
nr:polysaccharide deacetylase family protein [Ktedonobacter racemifer]